METGWKSSFLKWSPHFLVKNVKESNSGRGPGLETCAVGVCVVKNVFLYLRYFLFFLYGINIYKYFLPLYI